MRFPALVTLLCVLAMRAWGQDACSDVFPAATNGLTSFSLTPLVASGTNSVSANNNFTLDLAGGATHDYSSINANNGFTLNVTGSGTARLHLTGSMQLRNGAAINAGGNPEDLVIRVAGNVSIGNGAVINALIYAGGNIVINNGGSTNGALAAGANIVLGSHSVNYDAGAVTSADFAGMCTAAGPTLDRFDIDIPAGGAFCDPVTVTVTAEDSGGATLAGYTGTITVDTNTGVGDWSLDSGTGSLNNGAANDGVATYTFAAADNGTVSLLLDHSDTDTSTPISMNVSAVDGGVTDDDLEGSYAFTAGSCLALNCETFRDEFASSAYDRQDGSALWSSDWIEGNDDGDPSTGRVLVDSGTLRLAGTGGADPSIEREVDLSTFTEATLTFEYFETGAWEAGDRVEVQLSDDGGSNWTTVQTFSDDQGSTPLTAAPVNITAFRSANTRLRFQTAANADAERFFIDNVEIEACRPQAGGFWNFDEPVWDGTAGEVADASGNGINGTALGGAGTASADPAVPGTPGTCGYGVFDGNTAHVLIPHDPALNGNTALTYVAWINPDGWSSGIRQVMAKSVHGGGNGRAQMGMFSESGEFKGRAETSEGRVEVTMPLPPTGSWTHVALVFDGDSLSLYRDGLLANSTTFSTRTLVQTTDPLQVSKRVGTDEYYFDGLIDEVGVYTQALTAADIAAVRDLTRPCALVSPTDHFNIDSATIAVTCEAQPVTVSARLADDGVDASYVGTVTLSTSTGRGDWTLAGGSGVLTPGAADSGNASYVFAAADAGQVNLALAHPTAATVNVNVIDGSGITERSGTALPVDPDIQFRDTALRFFANGTANAIGTQISGKSTLQAPASQAIVVRALETDSETGACVGRLPPGPYSVDFAYECRTPGNCASNAALNLAGTDIDDNDLGAVSQFSTVNNLPFLEVGGFPQASIPFRYDDAGQIALYARLFIPAIGEEPAITLEGASNAFVVRPFALGIDSVNAGAQTNPGGTASGGAGFVAAATPFDYTIGAYRYDAADDANLDGAPDTGANVTNNGLTPAFAATTSIAVDAITPAAGSPGALSPLAVGAGAFSGGAADVLGASYSEAGSVDLLLRVDDYLGAVDADIVGRSGTIGRFFPDTFRLQATASGDACSSASAFTYLDQAAIGLDFELSALNAAGVVTANYDAALGYAVGTVLYHAENGDDGVDLGGRLSVPAGGFEAGVWQLPAASGSFSTTGASFNRQPGSVDGPFASLQLSLSVISDPDGRLLDAPDENPGEPGCGAGCTTGAIGAPLNLRYGRMRSVNAYGPETQALPTPLVAEYWNGQRWVVNADDGNGTPGCTQLPQAAVDLQAGSSFGSPIPIGGGNSTGSIAYPSGSDLVLNGGDAGLLFSAPGAGNTGEISVDVDLGALPWLRFDWDGDGVFDDDPPTTTATFGRFRGNDRIIYWRER